MRVSQSTYIAFRDGRYAHCPQGPKLGDKTRWDINHGGPRDPTLFALYQSVRLEFTRRFRASWVRLGREH